jgi:hypothetical protein
LLASVSPSDMAWIRTTVVPTVVTGELVQGHVGVLLHLQRRRFFYMFTESQVNARYAVQTMSTLRRIVSSQKS